MCSTKSQMENAELRSLRLSMDPRPFLVFAFLLVEMASLHGVAAIRSDLDAISNGQNEYSNSETPKNQTEAIHPYLPLRKLDIDSILVDSVPYYIIAGTCIVLSCVVSFLVLCHVMVMRDCIVDGAYDSTLLKEEPEHTIRRSVLSGGTAEKTRQERNQRKNRMNLYMDSRTVMCAMMFALMLPVHEVLDIMAYKIFPLSMICQTDIAPILLMRFPVTVMAIFLGLVAFKERNHHATLLHTIFVLYAMASVHIALTNVLKKEVFCMQTMMNIPMMVMLLWLAFWGPKIAGQESLRDKFAYEKSLLLLYDVAERERIRDMH